jgi:aminoglycoside phosphotransferase
MTQAPVQPVFGDAIAQRRLTGLSGANVFLVTRDERHWFIRKLATDQAASDRLRRQAMKQARFALELPDVLRTPRVLDEGEHDGMYYFDLEFVSGSDGATYLRRATYAEVSTFAERLKNYLTAASDCPPIGDGTFANLFDAVYSKVSEAQRITSAIDADSLSRLFLALEPLRHMADVRPTLCHGDLTLENMVVDAQGTIWVFDLLDSPFEHYWLDVAKLHQDLSGGWYLAQQPPVAKCVLDYVSRELLKSAEQLRPGYRKIHHLLVASTFVRILPYARTAERLRFVQERIEHFARLASMA